MFFKCYKNCEIYTEVAFGWFPACLVPGLDCHERIFTRRHLPQRRADAGPQGRKTSLCFAC